MKKIAKTLSLVLALVLCLNLMTACSGGDEKPENTTTQAPSNKPNATKPAKPGTTTKPQQPGTTTKPESTKPESTKPESTKPETETKPEDGSTETKPETKPESGETTPSGK